jgi:DNA-binding NarL/FixJ family response regulator
MSTLENRKIKVGIVDDHQLFSKSLSLLISNFTDFEVVMEANNGKDLQLKMERSTNLPEIMLIDVSMPVMDGPSTAKWLKQIHPTIKLAALSMDDKEKTIIEMVRSGCVAYMFKDIHPDELEKALLAIHHRGFYNSDSHNINFVEMVRASRDDGKFSPDEIEFLRLSCTDLTYREIAHQMKMTERNIDSVREILFKKLNVQSRTGMALEAIRKGLVSI